MSLWMGTRLLKILRQPTTGFALPVRAHQEGKRHGTPRLIRSTDALNWTQFTHHYVQRTNSSIGILEESQISDSQNKKQGTAESRINKGHKSEPREVNDRGLGLDQQYQCATITTSKQKRGTKCTAQKPPHALVGTLFEIPRHILLTEHIINKVAENFDNQRPVSAFFEFTKIYCDTWNIDQQKNAQAAVTVLHADSGSVECIRIKYNEKRTEILSLDVLLNFSVHQILPVLAMIRPKNIGFEDNVNRVGNFNRDFVLAQIMKMQEVRNLRPPGGGVMPDSVGKKSVFEREFGWSGLRWSLGQQFYSFIAGPTIRRLLQTPTVIGGPGLHVEIDETLISRRKNDGGRAHFVQTFSPFGRKTSNELSDAFNSRSRQGDSNTFLQSHRAMCTSSRTLVNAYWKLLIMEDSFSEPNVCGVEMLPGYSSTDTEYADSPVEYNAIFTQTMLDNLTNSASPFDMYFPPEKFRLLLPDWVGSCLNLMLADETTEPAKPIRPSVYDIRRTSLEAARPDHLSVSSEFFYPVANGSTCVIRIRIPQISKQTERRWPTRQIFDRNYDYSSTASYKRGLTTCEFRSRYSIVHPIHHTDCQTLPAVANRSVVTFRDWVH
ncbi:hypothetical protein CLF_112473 [Clonorchis sinensis]|uniref:Uncharacterized protein n=1 Tax=Clonorchis sinensis TaxID=79923 RepID=G7YMJ2_CLOSI|nr:hypothetical protein CLF_112473 [Clonorchis sinensis]